MGIRKVHVAGTPRNLRRVEKVEVQKTSEKKRIDVAVLQKAAPEMSSKAAKNLCLRGKHPVDREINKISQKMDMNLSFLAGIPPGAAGSKAARSIAAKITSKVKISADSSINKTVEADSVQTAQVKKIIKSMQGINHDFTRITSAISFVQSGVDNEYIAKQLGEGIEKYLPFIHNLIDATKEKPKDEKMIKAEVRKLQDFIVAELSNGDKKIEKSLRASLKKMEAMQGPPEKREATTNHHIKKGESLWQLAEKYYGDGSMWPLIAKANGLSTNGNPKIIAGAEIKIPPRPRSIRGIRYNSGDYSLGLGYGIDQFKNIFDEDETGIASFETVRKAGQRGQMKSGYIKVNGHTYKFNSGGGGNGNLPPGVYDVTRHRDSRRDVKSMMVDGVGYSFALSNKYDPRVGKVRDLLRIHPDGKSAGTIGCIGIVGDGDTQRRFRADMLAELKNNNGHYRLIVG